MIDSEVEGVARVVRTDGDTVWLEPEPTGSCGGCMSASVCGHAHGTSRRMASRRFSMANEHGLKLGERVVVTVDESSLLRASLTAYALPLLVMLCAGIAASKLGGGDGVAALATLGGLVAGLLLARMVAKVLSARGELSPRFVRRAAGPGPGESCQLD